MCTNYMVQGADFGLSELKIDSFAGLYRWTPWKHEIYRDYDAPIVASIEAVQAADRRVWFLAPRAAEGQWREGEGAGQETARHAQHDERARRQPRKACAVRTTWRGGRRYLIPVRFIVEPSYRDARQEANGDWVLGPHVWQRIGALDRPTMCVTGIWRALTNQDGAEHHVMSMITVNSDGHPLMSRMHRPADEKRSVVILRPDDWEEWLTTSNVEAAREMRQLYPVVEMTAESVVVTAK